MSSDDPTPYSVVSPGAGELPDALGPDHVRVTIRVEPAVDRLRRWQRSWGPPAVLTNPVGTYVDYTYAPGLIQKHLLRDRWVVDIEADSGEHCRMRAADRAAAITMANQVHAGVTADGVAFLRTFAR
ncbi:hypothetical protein Back2_27500 [Nocardioides baekrokdamisoli]|uniref:Uncharacterized protein n=1 Tax=Nocardioides baekrokdamisoli TaxID=1804624 RepID=A0A3G9J1E0_9ACTN|nr:hypothetical protein [Nocardioides baekrokdamisoli]BBH18463.1 hypothetical protein Back2_27500 [Nocardioides baekrokdamisoli]